MFLPLRSRPALLACAALGTIALVFANGAAFARAMGPFWMSENALQNAFSGAEITGTYSDGRTFNEKYDRTGALVYTEHEPSRHLTGSWSIVRGLFCTIYDNSGTGGCFRVHRASANCFEFYFETRTEEEARKSTPRNPSWTARAWRIDQVATCDGDPSV